MAEKEYIAVDSGTRATSQIVKMTNHDNEFCGTLKTRQDGSDKDIKEIFIQGATVDGTPVQVTTSDSGKKILDIHLPDSGGTIKSISLVGSEGSEIPATIDSNGHAEINIEELEFDEMWVDKLYLDGVDINSKFIDLSPVNEIQPIDMDNEEGFTMEDLANKYNELLAKLKSIASAQHS